MKHAGDATLDALEGLLQQIRDYGDLTERKRGIFYRKATAFLHFHEDATGIFADVKVGLKYSRFRASTRAEQRALMKVIQAQLKPS
jgi:hypothetical protein